MLTNIHRKRGLQMILGFASGILFGFFLQKGGVTRYDVIVGQLLLEDFTVLKVMLAAVVTGMLGIHALQSLKLVQLHPKPGSMNMAIWGGLLFGVGFAVLGYCPGTLAGAVGNGFLDAATGGLAGILVGAGLFAAVYGRIEKTILARGDLKEMTLPRLLKVNTWTAVLPAAALIVLALWLIEKAGL